MDLFLNDLEFILLFSILCLCMPLWVCDVSTGAFSSRGVRRPWSWSYKKLWATWHGCGESHLGPRKNLTFQWSISPVLHFLSSKNYILFTCMHAHMQACVYIRVPQHACVGQRTACGSRVSAFTIRVPGIKHRSLDLAQAPLFIEPISSECLCILNKHNVLNIE